MNDTFRFIVEDQTYLDTDTEIENEQDLKKRMENKIIYKTIDKICQQASNALIGQWKKETQESFRGKILINPKKIKSEQYLKQNYLQEAKQFFRQKLKYKLQVKKETTIRLIELLSLARDGKIFIKAKQQQKMKQSIKQNSNQ